MKRFSSPKKNGVLEKNRNVLIADIFNKPLDKNVTNVKKSFLFCKLLFFFRPVSMQIVYLPENDCKTRLLKMPVKLGCP